MNDDLVQRTIRLPKNYDLVMKHLAESRNITFVDVLREFLKSIIEGTEIFNGEVQLNKSKVYDIVYCQSCALECTKEYKVVRFRDDLFKFCFDCFDSEKYKAMLQNIAKLYEY